MTNPFKSKLGSSMLVAAVVVGAGSVVSVSAATKHRAQQVQAGYAKDQCKDGGFQALGFKNQGQCVSFFASGGKSNNR